MDVIAAYGLADSADQAELRAQMRANAEREEAQRDLIRLRARYWSGERLLDEASKNLVWWEHPEADPYAVLELLPGASIDDAASARRLIARTNHPDLTHLRGAASLDLARRRMVAANAAYERLRRALRPL